MGSHSYLSEYIVIYVNVICPQLYEISHDSHTQWPKHAAVRHKHKIMKSGAQTVWFTVCKLFLQHKSDVPRII